MMYDLSFWKYEPGVALDHRETHERLCDGQIVEGVATLPIDQVKRRVREVFKGWECFDDEIWDGEDAGSFQLFTTPQYFRAECFGMEGEEMNKLIDIAAEFDCSLYDPQVKKRFDSSAP